MAAVILEYSSGLLKFHCAYLRSPIDLKNWNRERKGRERSVARRAEMKEISHYSIFCFLLSAL